MKILHLATFDHGGAAAPMKTLHEKLLENQIESAAIILHKKTSTVGYHELKLPRWKRILQRVRNKIQFSLYKETLHQNKYFFRIHRDLYSISPNDVLRSAPFIPSIIYVHWVEGFINFKLLNAIQKKINCHIVFANPDAANITGGCHNTFGCKEFQKNCHPCPAIKNKNLSHIAAKQLQNKKKFLPKNNISIVSAPILGRLFESSLFANKTIFFNELWGEDPVIFHPGNKENIKKKYGIAENKRVLLFGSETVSDERKGFNLLINALQKLSNNLSIEEKENIIVAIAGRHDKNILRYENIPFNQLLLNFTNNQNTLVEYYQLADVYVCPTIDDLGPWMVFQSLMCGVPVVAFKMGIAGDLVNEDTGYIAKLKDEEDLKEGLSRFIRMSAKELKEKQNNARNLALSKINLDVQFKKYLEMLKSLN